MVYKWSILPLGWFYIAYHLWKEPETAIDLVIHQCIRWGEYPPTRNSRGSLTGPNGTPGCHTKSWDICAANQNWKKKHMNFRTPGNYAKLYLYREYIYIYVYTYWKPTWPLFDWKRPSWSESGAENWGQTSFFLYTSTFKRVPYMVPKKMSIHHSLGFKWHPFEGPRYIYCIYIYIYIVCFFESRTTSPINPQEVSRPGKLSWNLPWKRPASPAWCCAWWS